MSNSKLDTDIWLNYAKIIDVGVKTSFYMGHRILDAIKNYQGIGQVSGIVEMDETFLPERFKGNHKKMDLGYNEILVREENKLRKEASVANRYVSLPQLKEAIISSLRWLLRGEFPLLI